MKIYTKTGDGGTTSLAGGRRVKKNDIRIEAYGTVDELNSFVGLLAEQDIPVKDLELLLQIQNKLFSVGASLATDTQDKEKIAVYSISDSDIAQIEERMDEINGYLIPPNGFVLPGGSPDAAMAHICRTVCRRAERRITDLKETADVDKNILRYINRLSDYFFVLARFVIFFQKKQEFFWKK
jgi:cob(I)alamin adenosyltransferase